MGSPKSFKDMTFPVSRGGSAASVGKLVISPVEEIPEHIKALRARKLKEMKDLLMVELCPLCGLGLDGGIKYDGADLYCTTGEYECRYVYGCDMPSWCKYVYYGSSRGFQFSCTHDGYGVYDNVVSELDLTLSVGYRDRRAERLFSFRGNRVFFKSGITEKEIMEKFRLLSVFG